MEREERAAFTKVNESFATVGCGQSWTLEEQFAANAMTDDHVERGGFRTFWNHFCWSFAAPFGNLRRCYIKTFELEMEHKITDNYEPIATQPSTTPAMIC